MIRNYIIIFVLFQLLLGTHCMGSEDTLANPRSELVSLPPLTALIDSAIQKSSIIDLHNNQIKQNKVRVDVSKNKWTESIKFNSNYVYGTSVENVTLPFNANPTQWFGLGTSVSLPLIDILNRKEQIEIAKLEMAKNIDNLRYVKDNIRLDVISSYSAIQLNSKILYHREEALSVCKMQLSYADLEYNNNSIEIADFSRVHDSYVKSIVAYEQARSNYLNSIVVLEELTGVNLR